VDEVTKERRFVGTGVGSRKLVIPVRFDVPVSVDIARVVLLDTGGLNLLETPLRQVDVTSTEVAIEINVSETEGGSESAELGVIARRSVVNNLNDPVVLGISNGSVAVARNFVVCLGDRSSNRVGVQVAAGLSVDQTNGIAVADKLERSIGIELGLVAVGVEEPVVVGVLVVVASDLLLLRALGEGLNVRVQKTTTVSHVLESGTRAKGDFERAIDSDFGTLEVGLEERAHLSITRTAVLEDQEVHVEREHVNDHGNDNQTDDAETEVSCELSLEGVMSVNLFHHHIAIVAYLGHLEVAKLVPQVLDGVQTNQSSSEHTNPLDTADTADRETAQQKPQKPLGGEGLLLKSVETSPAENSGESKEEKHRVEQNETTDGGVRVLEQNHQGDEPSGGLAEVELLCSVVGQGDAQSTESCVELAHEDVVDLLGISLTRLELEGTVVTGQITRKANQHLSQRRVDIEVEFALEVVRAKFAKMRLVPGDNGRKTDLPQTGEEGECGEDDGCEDGLPVVDDICNALSLGMRVSLYAHHTGERSTHLLLLLVVDYGLLLLLNSTVLCRSSGSSP